MPDSFGELSLSQQEIVKHTESPVLVLAGPGTGKTEILAHRITYLLNNRIASCREITAVTFTTKAAKEMKERLERLKVADADKICISTLHSLARNIIHENTDKIGLRRDFIIVDGYEARLVMHDTLQDVGVAIRKPKELTEYLACIEEQKAKCINSSNNLSTSKIDIGLLRRIYKRYQENLRFNNAVDFHDLVLEAVNILSQHSEVLVKYRKRTAHLLVDEYQDINHAEFKLIKLLAGNAEGLFTVGDDDQSVYGWRKADIGIILNFKKDFKNGTIRQLDESWRCPKHILEGALALISNNKTRFPKQVKAMSKNIDLIQVLESPSETKEARWIAGRIKDIKEKVKDSKLEDFTILCPNRKLVETLRKELKKQNINFELSWLKNELLNKESVRNILAYIRLLINRHDNLALRRCLTINTKIDDEAIKQLRHFAEKESLSLWESFEKNSEVLGKKERSFKKFESRINELDKKCEKLNIQQIIVAIAEEVGCEDKPALERLLEMSNNLPGRLGLLIFLQEVNTSRGLYETGQSGVEEKDAVMIMSVHESKGLGRKIIFLLGMHEGIFPNPQFDLEEQRRLCYVAMTRAKEVLYMCWSRRLMGSAAKGFNFFNPSRFLDEIPLRHKAVLKVN